MFKRLHQSGSNAKFVAVDWWGDESQIPESVPVIGGITPDYYVNVEHAFATASSLAVSINQMLPGRKVVAAHSLGNVLVASAIVDYGLVASSYFMFNAAVPVEAFADVPVETNMVNPDWRDYASYLWASKWHEAFPATDGRHALSWRGCFANLTNYCNFYSSTEDVLDNVGASIPFPQRQWAWGTQELHKGTTFSYWMPGHCEGGWGFNGDYDPWFDSFPTPEEATNLITMATLQTNSLFRRFDDPQLYTPAGDAFAHQPVIRARLLADAIPALSFAAGRNVMVNAGGGITNIDLLSFRRGPHLIDAWPRELDDWQHSDLKEIAFPYLGELFEYIVEQGALR
ncbi:MAG: hypothetical protein J6Y19_10305 [Kiritimatiellae bacterium]|nr:hypothetical protein [Kiritimatiellia bacterium]